MTFKRNTIALSLAAMLLSFTGATAFADDGPKIQYIAQEPISPTKPKVLEDGRIKVWVGTPKSNGYAIGNSMPINVVFELTPDKVFSAAHPAPPPAAPEPVKVAPQIQQLGPETVHSIQPMPAPPGPHKLPLPKISVPGLEMGVLTSDPSDVELLSNKDGVYVKTQEYRHGDEVNVLVTFYVTNFVTTQKDKVAVKADFMYAVDETDGQPNWQSATTPEIMVAVHTTAAFNQTKMVEGDLQVKASPKAPAAFIGMWIAPVLMMPLLASIAFWTFMWLTRAQRYSSEDLTLATIRRVEEDAARHGKFESEHFRHIFSALRQYLEVEPGSYGADL